MVANIKNGPTRTLVSVVGVDANGKGGTAPIATGNLNAIVDPTVNNDSSQGYSIGSVWQNANTGRVFVARSVSVGSAAWVALAVYDHPGYLTNNWYLGQGLTNVASGTAPGLGSIRLYLTGIEQRCTLSSLGVRVSTVSASGNVQAAIYANSPSTIKPTGNPLASTASMSTTSAASVNSAISLQLEAGLYWFATNCDNATAAFTQLIASTLGAASRIGSTSQANCLGNTTTMLGYSVAQTFGTWPDLTSASFADISGGNALPIVQFKVGSVP